MYCMCEIVSNKYCLNQLQKGSVSKFEILHPNMLIVYGVLVTLAKAIGLVTDVNEFIL